MVMIDLMMDDVMMRGQSCVLICTCSLYLDGLMIILMMLIIFLSSLKKNRKATFDVLFWGVLYSAFFVSMMELGVPNLTPPQSDPMN